ncbi:MAG TPA: carboxypeptidase-like regulatory domain-containing protein [Pyrinomonadaceae bacterium]|jgi:hypothetical protein|nr:carboxypeptidase-like regulatory domain-containing protein [Pyrinomonadaceae bacterium]
MSGDAQARHCRECDKQVYNFSLLTRGEIETLIAGAEGRLCARFSRRADGSIDTADSPVGTSRARRRAPLTVGAALSAALSLCANALAQAPAVKAAPATKDAAHAPQREGARRESARVGKTAALRGTIYDIEGAVVPQASVILLNEATNQESAATTDEEGVYRFANVGAGTYTLTAQSPGFVSFRKSQLDLKAGKDVRLDVTLQVGVMGEIVVVPKHGALSRVSDTLLFPYRVVRKVFTGKSR